MKRNCNDYMDEYLALDKGERVPVRLALHLLTCRKCRHEVRLLAQSERQSARLLAKRKNVAIDTESITRIMEKLDVHYNRKDYSVPFWRWSFGVGFIPLVVFCPLALATGENSSQVLSFALYMTFAGIITVYCALFIGNNLDFFIKRSPSSKHP